MSQSPYRSRSSTRSPLEIRARWVLGATGTAVVAAVTALSLVRELERPPSPIDAVYDAVAVDSAAGSIFYAEDLIDASVLDTAALRRAVDVVRGQVARGTFPGAALVVGRGGDVALSSGIGRVAWEIPSWTPPPRGTTSRRSPRSSRPRAP